MEKKTILRLTVLTLLFAVAVIGIASVPHDGLSAWFQALFISKAIGFTAAYAFLKLYRRWRKTDKGIQYYEKQLFS